MNFRSISRIGSFVLLIVLGLSVLLPTAPHQVVFAQDDAQTPDALCEAALPNIVEPENRRYSEAEDVLEDGIDYQAIFCTDKGAIYVDLFENYTPLTVNNFVFLAEEGYYNNSEFHRVIQDFMVQGGDPVGNPAGTGNPGYSFGDEFLPFLGMQSEGWLAMANAGPGTNGAQFFITRAATTWLHGAHTVFGRVLEGQEVATNITNREGAGDPPADKLNTVLIITDPSTVNSDYVAPARPTDEETLDAIINAFDGDESLTQSHAEIIDPSSMDEATQAFYEEHSFQFGATGLWQTAACSDDNPLLGIGLSMVDWDTVENAIAVVDDDAVIDLFAADDFELVETDAFTTAGFTTDLLFSRSISEICDKDATHYSFVWNRGRYTFGFDTIITDGFLPPEQVPAILASNIGFPLAAVVGEYVFTE